MLLLDSYAVAINYIEKETIQKNEIQPGFESVSTSIVLPSQLHHNCGIFLLLSYSVKPYFKGI